VQKIFKRDEIFPSFLKQIPDSPNLLYCFGDISLLSKRCITIVGTRKMTKYGREVVRMLLGKFLRDLDIVVVSGLAMGVDEYVHRVCLEKGIKTIAVVPGGIDTAIPSRNKLLLKEIWKKGLILAEFPQGEKWFKHLYIQRNRILAGVSSETIVIEAGEKSGSLTTAKLALDYNRDVYVVPGNITSEVSKGCNILAKQGANLITCIEDMKELVGIVGEQVTFY